MPSAAHTFVASYQLFGAKLDSLFRCPAKHWPSSSLREHVREELLDRGARRLREPVRVGEEDLLVVEELLAEAVLGLRERAVGVAIDREEERLEHGH